MSYTIRKFNGTELVVLQDGTIDTSTSVALVGRNYTGYGELQNSNFLHILENFANDAPPARPIAGQTWFNSSNNNLHVYDGSKWNLIGTAVVSTDEPIDPTIGSLWFDVAEAKLYCWTGQWTFIGPETSPGFAETRSKSTTVSSITGEQHAVIITYVNGTAQSIYSSTAFTIAPLDRPEGFTDLVPGLNFSTLGSIVKGRLDGTAAKATLLETTRLINGIGFNGSSDISINAPTPFHLVKGDYIVGNSFNGSRQVTWSVDANSNNVIGTIVARDSAGDFSANTITANLIGNVQGNVNISSGTSIFNRIEANEIVGQALSGNANSATRLRNPRNINGIAFDGTQDITIPVNGDNVTGTRLANNVVNSNLQTLGTLTELFVSDTGIKVGNNLKLLLTAGNSTISVENFSGLTIQTLDNSVSGNYSKLSFLSASANIAEGGNNTSGIIPRNSIDLGSPAHQFSKIYSNEFIGTFQGTCTLATTSTTANNLAAGTSGSIPYQTAVGTTNFIPPGIPGQILRSSGIGEPFWGNATFSVLGKGNYLTGSDYDGLVSTTWSVDATPLNIADKVVARDSSGNFSAGIITATLDGNITGNSETVTTLNSAQITAALGFTPAQNTLITTFQSASFSSMNNNGNMTITKSNPTIFLNDSSDSGIELAISVQGENMIFYEPEDSNKEWFRIDDSQEKGYLFGQEIVTTPSRIKAWVKFDGSSLSIAGSLNVSSVVLESSGRYRIIINSGVFADGNFAAAGLASDTDHFVVYRSSDATNLYINTVDNGSGNDSPSTTSGFVTIIMVG